MSKHPPGSNIPAIAGHNSGGFSPPQAGPAAHGEAVIQMNESYQGASD
jgi:hypothetical protein